MLFVALSTGAERALADCLEPGCGEAPGEAASPKPWPPPLASLTSGGRCSADLRCDPEAGGTVSLEGWEWVLETTASDCPRVVGLTDGRARTGNVTVRPVRARLEGTCVVSRAGEIIGAVHAGVLALCSPSQEAFGVTAHQSVVAELRAGGAGEALVPLRRLPRLLTGGRERCDIQLRVELRAPPAAAVGAR